MQNKTETVPECPLEHSHKDCQHPELPLPGQKERKHRDARVGRDADRDEGA